LLRYLKNKGELNEIKMYAEPTENRYERVNVVDRKRIDLKERQGMGLSSYPSPKSFC